MSVSAAGNTAHADLVAGLNGRGAGAGAVQEMSDRFLKLLVTQLKNQDPMNPMENAELTMQLAQMSTVEGINKLNDGLAALNDQYRATQVIQGAGLVGRNVLAAGEDLSLGPAGAVGGAELEAAADSVRVQVLDRTGMLVQTLDLGRQPAGLARFVWDGKDHQGVPQPQGEYAFRVLASADGRSVPHTAYSLGTVMSVALQGAGMEVEVAGLGSRSLAQIRQIY